MNRAGAGGSLSATAKTLLRDELRPYLSDSRPQKGSPKKVPTEKAEKISAICQAGASNDLA